MVLRTKPKNRRIWFWGKTKKHVLLSPCACCRLHTVSPDLSIVRPPSTRPMLDYSRSSAPGLLLLPRSSSLPAMSHLPLTHHEISKRDSPHKIDSSRTTEIFQIWIQTMTCQWLIIIKPTKVLTTWFLNAFWTRMVVHSVLLVFCNASGSGVLWPLNSKNILHPIVYQTWPWTRSCAKLINIWSNIRGTIEATSTLSMSFNLCLLIGICLKICKHVGIIRIDNEKRQQNSLILSPIWGSCPKWNLPSTFQGPTLVVPCSQMLRS
jgi:hypothetical protein